MLLPQVQGLHIDFKAHDSIVTVKSNYADVVAFEDGMFKA
jgi:hypothetical protein